MVPICHNFIHCHFLELRLYMFFGCGQGYVFTAVCDSAHRGQRGLARRIPPAWRTLPGMENPPGMENHPQTRHHHPRADPPGSREPPQTRHPPPRSREPHPHPPPGMENPPGKQTPTYGLRAAGTHPTGMHSCFHFHLR